jgi:hypothetical protein
MSLRGTDRPTTLYSETGFGFACPVTFIGFPVCLFHSTFAPNGLPPTSSA